MKTGVVTALSLSFAALLVTSCGDGSSATSKAGGPAGSQPATPPGGVQPATSAQGGAADDGEDGASDILGVLDDLPTQDELDAAAAARIDESMAEAEYAKLKAEIENDLADPEHVAEAEAEEKAAAEEAPK